MIIAIALATQTAPRDWWDEDDATLATAIDLLDEQRQRMER